MTDYRLKQQQYREIRQPSPLGKAMRLLFFAFNALMLVWLVAYWVRLAGFETASSAEEAGLAIGGLIGTTMLMVIWAAGAGILGALMLATRGPKIVIPVDTDVPQPPHWKTAAMAGIGFVIAFAVATAIIGKPELARTSVPSVAVKPDTPFTPRRAHSARCEVSLAQFQRLVAGMTYAQAVGVLGCEGAELSRVDLAGYRTVMFMWDGNSLMANMNAMFQNDRLTSKAQFGLK